MKRVFLCFLLGMGCARGQPAETRRIEEIVVHGDGRPAEFVEIHHTGKSYSQYKTDVDGHFTVETRAPAFVFRKVGYVSQRVMAGETLMLVTLKRDSAARTYPTCAPGTNHRGLEGGFFRLKFPHVGGVEPKPQFPRTNYIALSYRILASKGEPGILHGGGGLWGLGLPSNSDVWQNVDFEETNYLIEGSADYLVGTMVTDSRGRFSDGTRWRRLGVFGETASYTGVDQTKAKLLDQVLDGGCLV